MTSRQLVFDTLNFRNTDGRVPRQLWSLPWAELHYPKMIEKIRQDFVWDFGSPATALQRPPLTKGEPYQPGEYIDEWGCKFQNIQPGIIGEVKEPLIRRDDWSDAGAVNLPEGWLTFDADMVNHSCAQSELFMMGGCCPRPFEQLQFLRGTVNLYMDLMDMPPKMCDFLEKMHDFYCRLITKWAQTDVDALNFMDDWGSQQGLLINPEIWVKVFKPMYRDYIEIAHRYGKKAFMHSDGNTLSIIPHLIDIGLDAFNTQIFCIGVDKLAPFRGKITFWGEIDRQHLLPYGSLDEIDRAVDCVYNTLWNDGGCIAQCEFGAGANPDNVYEVFKRWASIRAS